MSVNDFFFSHYLQVGLVLLGIFCGVSYTSHDIPDIPVRREIPPLSCCRRRLPSEQLVIDEGAEVTLNFTDLSCSSQGEPLDLLYDPGVYRILQFSDL